MDTRCPLVSQSQEHYGGITSSSLLPLLGLCCAKSMRGAMPEMPATEVQFLPPSPKES